MSKKPGTAIVAALAVALAALAFLAGCGGATESQSSNSSPVGASTPNGTIEGVQQQAINATRQANLMQIDQAIQVYYNEYNKWPTSISQLGPYFARGVPKDPAGGTYYIVMQGGTAKAAVK